MKLQRLAVRGPSLADDAREVCTLSPSQRRNAVQRHRLRGKKGVVLSAGWRDRSGTGAGLLLHILPQGPPVSDVVVEAVQARLLLRVPLVRQLLLDRPDPGRLGPLLVDGLLDPFEVSADR